MGWDSGSYSDGSVSVINIPDFSSGSVGFDSPQPLPADLVAADNAAAANVMANISGQAPAFESPLPFDTTQIPADLNTQLQSFTQSLMSQLVSIQGLTSNLTAEQKAVNDAAAAYTKAYNDNAGIVAQNRALAARDQAGVDHNTGAYRQYYQNNVNHWNALADAAQAKIDAAKATYTADLKAYQDNLATLKSTVTDYTKNYTDYTKAVQTGQVDAKATADAAKAASDAQAAADKAAADAAAKATADAQAAADAQAKAASDAQAAADAQAKATAEKDAAAKAEADAAAAKAAQDKAVADQMAKDAAAKTGGTGPGTGGGPSTTPSTGPGTGGTGGGGAGDTPSTGKDAIGTPSTDPSTITTTPSTEPTTPTTPPITPPTTDVPPPTPDVPTPPDEPKAKDPYVPLQTPDDWNLQFRLGPLNLKGGGGGGGRSSAPVYASSDPLSTSLLGTGLSTRPDVSSTEAPYLLGTDEAKKNVWNTESLKNALGI